MENQQTSLENHKILVVDDDVRLRTFIAAFLEEQGYIVSSQNLILFKWIEP